ncbi:folylpolyglutamate synthase, mitochondrial-like [Gigantopelta aegis]|uniref:folylpolyglutamate synthase, mitochondrial-like n=1 Tax=Gigantopelta aegis TaxID=1735272 RepID=UPI001B887F3B|nr:folylpolyglutamate synthase, mitochondrial-like [Gigantopelta aegis]
MDSVVEAEKPGSGSSSYQDAMSIVRSLKSDIVTRNVAVRQHNIPFTTKTLKCCDITLEDIDRLRIIHITGTKGKGSTSAFCESILRHSGYKTGFFSSPSLVKLNERFRINGQPLSDEDFCSYFFDVYNKIEPILKNMRDREIPALFSFFTTMAFTVFIKEKVDVVVMEVGIGGQLDCTNVIRSPVVCGVTSLGLDHVDKLGDTIEKIAWHKAGIFKKGVPALTVSQPPEADAVLLERSQEIGASLYRVPTLHEFCAAGQQIRLGIEGNIQFVNAGLALQLCRVFLHRTNKENQYVYDVLSVPSVKDIPMLPVYQLSPEETKGLALCSWPGRAQTIYRPRLTYYLDGAHTKESMQQCVEWFLEKSEEEAATIKGRVYKVLLFTLSGHRSIASMLSILKVINFDEVVFCPGVDLYKLHAKSSAQSNEILMNASEKIKMTWDTLCGNCPEDDCVNNDHCPSTLTSVLQTCPVTGRSTTSDHMNKIPSPHCDVNKSSSRMNTENDTNNGNCPSYAFPSHLQALYWATQGREPKLSPDANSDLYNVPERLKDADHIQVLVLCMRLVGAVLGVLSNDASN